MSVSFYDVVFFAVALLIIAASLGVIVFKNIIHSALSLILAFLGVAAVYFQLNAGFIGLVQIMVYAGAVSVLIIFAIMLVMDKSPEKTNLPTPSKSRRLIGLFVALLLALTLGGAAWFSEFPAAAGKMSSDAVGMLAGSFMGDYVIAFEIAAILLLVAVIGAIILAKGADDKK